MVAALRIAAALAEAKGASVMIARPSVLFVCRDNAGLSLLAEAVTMHFYPHVRAFSGATAAPASVDPAALACLEEAGIASSGLGSKPVEVFGLSGAPRVDVMVALVEEAHRAARRRPWTHPLRLRGWGFDDVTTLRDPSERLAAYRRLLPDLREAVTALVERGLCLRAA